MTSSPADDKDPARDASEPQPEVERPLPAAAYGPPPRFREEAPKPDEPSLFARLRKALFGGRAKR